MIRLDTGILHQQRIACFGVGGGGGGALQMSAMISVPCCLSLVSVCCQFYLLFVDISNNIFLAV